MKRHLIFLLFFTVCISLCLVATDELLSQRGMKTITVHTKEGKAIELYKDSYALVIGNGNYTNGWDPLDGALKDVKEVETVLKKHGFHVTLKKNLTKAQFDRAFAEFVLTSGEDPNNRLLFYYAGHGYTRKNAADEDLGYLVMIDAPTPEVDKVGFELESIPMKSLVGLAEKILARHALFIFDSCFSGTILNARDSLNPPESISDSVKYPVRQFITAGRAGETVPDHSDFKQAFLDLLEGRANEPFPDGYITGEELGFYLKNQVPVYNSVQHPQYGKIRNPKLDKGDFVFVLSQEAAWTPPPEERPTIATLTVTSTPRGATVYIDGAFIGLTPLQDYKIDTGARRVKQVEVGLELSGYKSRVVQLTLKGDQSTPWEVHLEKTSQIQSSGAAPEGMVLIPAGEFQMGSNDGDSDEKPVHTVYVDAFYMDIYEVTNAQYKQFVNANPQWGKDRIPSNYHDGNYLKHWSGNTYPTDKEKHPVRHVSWYAAMAYAQWAGKRLPTEAEWEKAARGGLIGKKYPWGNKIDSTKASYDKSRFLPTRTAAVGVYPANGYGLYDMAGNVWEWCLDAYDSDFYEDSPRHNPIAGADNVAHVIDNFTGIANNRVLRGGSWADRPDDLRVANRSEDFPAIRPSFTYGDDIGFRCVRAQ